MPETDETTNTLKTRRAAAKAAPKPDAEPVPVDVDVPPEIGVGEPARRYPLLGDPREPLVLGQSGMTLGGDHGGKYVCAEVDGWERILPKGCTTPIVRSRWRVGQMVLRSVYEAHVAALAEAEEPQPEKTAS